MKGRTALLLVACAFAVWAAADARDLLGPYPYSQCGGQGGICSNAAGSKFPCVDAPWAGFKCKTGLKCYRVSNWYRQCDVKQPPIEPDGKTPRPSPKPKPTPKPTPPVPASAFRQCGGKGGECGKNGNGPCADKQWPATQNGKCYTGLTCYRVSEWHYGCDTHDPTKSG